MNSLYSVLLTWATLCFVALSGFSDPRPGYAAEHMQGIDYRRLRREAPELLHLRIDRVTVVNNGRDTIEYRIEASVDKVERSGQGYKKGDRMTFESYYVKPEAWRRGFAGPESPPKLYPGWTGWIFLDQSPSGQGLGPAAYGRSFHYSFDLPPMPLPGTPAANQGGVGNLAPVPAVGNAANEKANGKVGIDELTAKLSELRIRTTSLLVEKGYFAEAVQESEAMSSDALRSLELLMKGDIEGWKRHYAETLKKALERDEEVKRLPKKPTR
ncbi:MAG: hypothetical protein ACKO38_11750 [Planctomycetota bacterium]